MKLIRLAATLLVGWMWDGPAIAADYSLAVAAVMTREISEPNLVMSGAQVEAGVKVTSWLGLVPYYDREFFRLTYTNGTTSGSDLSYGLGLKLAPLDYVYVQPFFGRVIRTYGPAVDTDYRYGAAVGIELPIGLTSVPGLKGTLAYKLSQDMSTGNMYGSLWAGLMLLTAPK